MTTRIAVPPAPTSRKHPGPPKPVRGRRFFQSSWLALVALLVALAGCGDKADEHPYQGVVLEKDTLYVSARRWEPHGLEQLTQHAGQVRLQPAAPALKALRGDGEITLFIHGYHASESTVETYFGGLIAHLRGVGAGRGQFMVLDWPSIARHWTELSNKERTALAMGSEHPERGWEIIQYEADRQMVKRIGTDALLSSLDTLGATNPRRRVNIVAHSMGCALVAEAMRKRPQSFAAVSKVLWLAPDLKDNALEDAALAPALARIGHLDVLFSREDNVLKYLSGLLNISKMLGAYGPARPGALPGNVVAHDLTQALGSDGVHGRYLEKGSASAHAVAKILSATGPTKMSDRER